MRQGFLRATVLMVAVMAVACGDATPPPQNDTTTAVLESGTDLKQPKSPVERIGIYMNGFHVSKDEPTIQMQAHHFCNQVDADLAQCVLFDGNTGTSRLMGVEYIISEKLYNTLPAEEKAFWHPHNYEILSGQLRVPGVPRAVEKEVLKRKINSYGKAWYTWMAGGYDRTADPLPYGPPRLQWSFTKDDEAGLGLVTARDNRFGFDTATERRDRQDLTALARPQGGVDAMAALFPTAKPVKGVLDNGDAATRPVPTFGMKDAEPQPAGR